MNYKDDEVSDTASSQNSPTYFNISKHLQLNIMVNNESSSIQANANQSIPLMVNLEISTPKIDILRPTVDIVFVLDASASMQGKKLENLKQGFEQVVSVMSPEDRVSIVMFNHNSERLTPLMRMTEENKKKSIEAVE